MSDSAKLTLETVAGEGLRFGVIAGSGPPTQIDSGRGKVAPSPTEMFLVALAGCHAMDVISILRKKRQRVTSYEVDVRGDRRAEHPRAFTNIEIVHRLTGHALSPGAIEHAIELSRTTYCSVHASLHPGIAVTNRFEIVPVERETAGR